MSSGYTKSDIIDLDSVVDQLNDMKAENAQLRRQLLARVNHNEGGDVPVSDPGHHCRVCAILEAQIDRLSHELATAREEHVQTCLSLNAEIKSLASSVMKERERRTRMEQIMERQMAYIHQIHPGDHEDHAASESSCCNDPGGYLNRDYGVNHDVCHDEPPVESSFVPPWDIDMDDLTRQLGELNENVHRVEVSTTRLNSSKKAVIDPHSIPKANRNQDRTAVDSIAPKASGVLGKVFSGIGQFSA